MGRAVHSSTEAFVAKYDYMWQFSKSRWAWEFLRRNKLFYSDATDHRAGQALEAVHCGVLSYRQSAPSTAAERWGLIFIPDPDKSGYEADVFWSLDQYPRSLAIHVAASETRVHDPILERSRRNCEIIHLRDHSGAEHLLLRGAAYVAQVRCEGRSFLSSDPYVMKLVVESESSPKAIIGVLERGGRVFDPSKPPPEVWPVQALRLRNALIAIDAADAGLTLFETAKLLYGADQAEADWRSAGTHLKDKVRRLKSLGENLRSDGYRKLVAFGD